MIQRKFLSACRENKIKIVKEILEKEGNRLKIDEIGNDGRTALYWAIANSSIDLVRMLIENGCNVDTPSIAIVRDEASRNEFFRFHEPPVVTASRVNSSTIAEYLIFNGGQVNEKSILIYDKKFEHVEGPDFKPGITALHYAAYHHNTVLITLLIGHGANVNAIDYEGNTPLHVAAVCKCGESKCYQQVEVIDLLCQYRSDLSLKNRKSCSALLISVMYGCLPSVVALLKSPASKNNANLFSLGKNQSSPLHVASYKDRHDILKYLIKAGLQLDPLDHKQLTPLQINITNHSSSPVAFTLIYHGCDVNCYQRPPNFPSLMTIVLRNPRFDCESLAYILLKVGYDLNQDMWLISDDGLETDDGVLCRDNFFSPKRIETALAVPQFYVPNGRLQTLQSWLQSQLRKPRILSDLCRITIRRILYEVVGEISIQNSIQKLNLPHILESFLQLQNFVELSENDLIKVVF